MRYPKIVSIFLVTCCASGGMAEEACSYRPTTPAPSSSPLIVRGDWLAVEHLRVGLDAPQRFMPGTAMRSLAKPATLDASPTPIDLDRVTALDPDNGAALPLRALLEARLYADGILVLRGDQILLEHYRTGFSPSSARLLLQATRPILAAMLAEAAETGRLARQQSLAGVLPELAGQVNLRKTSVQRLLDDRTGLGWSAEDHSQWLSVAGWKTAAGLPAPGDVRSWLKKRGLWPRIAEHLSSEIGGPEGELLVWVLENATKKSASRGFCESVLAEIGAEHEAFWASDPSGTGLADGLALSLRDFARFGMAVVQARDKGGTGRVVPHWFAESLAAIESHGNAAPQALRGLGADLGWKYRFAKPGQTHQAAIIGPFSNSLLIDFDRKLVVVLFASVPKDYSALALASLRSLWSAIGRSLSDQSF